MEMVFHCELCEGPLDPQSIEVDDAGVIRGTCWHCVKDDVVAMENSDED